MSSPTTTTSSTTTTGTTTTGTTTTGTTTTSTGSTSSTGPRFSAEVWAAFWADPQVGGGSGVLAEDIVGHWPESPEPVVGLEAYTARIVALLTALPDLRLELVDSAAVPGGAAGEELVFLHYLGRATGPDGPVRFRGLDRVRTRDGLVVENVVRYCPSHLVTEPARDGRRAGATGA